MHLTYFDVQRKTQKIMLAFKLAVEDINKSDFLIWFKYIANWH